MDLVAHRQEVAKGLRNLESRIAQLIDALAHRPAIAIVEGETSAGATRRVCEAYSTIDYGMTDALNQSLVCLGIVGVNSELLKRAQTVNGAKLKFKAICAPLQGLRVRIPVKGEAVPTKAISAIRMILRNIQRSDLNLLAAYRKIPILGAPPTMVTYTRANTRAVYRKTVDQVFEMLSNKESSTASADRARLQTLDPRIRHLALVKERHQNVRANVLYSHLDARGRGRIQISAELPLIYATGRRAEPPQVQFPLEKENGSDSRRTRESKLEAAPFLHALPVYRYK